MLKITPSTTELTVVESRGEKKRVGETGVACTSPDPREKISRKRRDPMLNKSIDKKSAGDQQKLISHAAELINRLK